jgi:thioredoxin 1
MEPNLNPAEFDAILAHGPAVILFFAPWCPNCRSQGPVLNQLSKQHGASVRFGRVNIDRQPQLAGRFSVRSVPTIVFFKGGREVKRLVGARKKDEIEPVVVGLARRPGRTYA